MIPIKQQQSAKHQQGSPWSMIDLINVKAQQLGSPRHHLDCYGNARLASDLERTV